MLVVYVQYYRRHDQLATIEIKHLVFITRSMTFEGPAKLNVSLSMVFGNNLRRISKYENTMPLFLFSPFLT